MGYVRCSNGGYKRTASGAMLDCDCVCFNGTVDCSGAAASYVVSAPASITWGSCSTPVACGSPVASATVLLLATCFFGSAPNLCIGGWVANAAASIQISTVSIGGCWYWAVDFAFITDIFPVVRYIKKMATGTDTPVGTYALYFIGQPPGTACIGASADATITVSP